MEKELQSIGRYQVKKLLALTPSHRIYLALDPQTTEQVTLTVSAAESTPYTKEAIQQEIALSHLVSHPGIQRVIEAGEESAVGPYLVKSYVDGVKLSQVVKQKLSLETSLHLLTQLCHAVDAAEKAGVVHGDIKPDNVMVSVDGQVTLMDFHACVKRGATIARQRVCLSPGYAAPEVVQGQAPDSLSDLFSFAVTAHEVLTGLLPFDIKGERDPAQVTCTQEPVLAEGLSPDMCMTLQKGMEKEPSRRFQSMAAFMSGLIASAPLPEGQVETLLDFLHGTPTPIHGIGAVVASLVQPGMDSTQNSPCATRPVETPKSRKASPLPKVLGLVGLVSAAGVAWWLWGRAPQTKTVEAPASPVVTTAPVKSPIVAPWKVDIRTEPMGATLSVDGKEVGVTPQEGLVLSRGQSHVFTLRLSGYEPHTWNLQDGESTPSLISLVAEPLAVLPPKRVREAASTAPPAKKTPKPVKAKAPAAPHQAPPDKKEFNLYEHLMKQERNP